MNVLKKKFLSLDSKAQQMLGLAVVMAVGALGYGAFNLYSVLSAPWSAKTVMGLLPDLVGLLALAGAALILNGSRKTGGYLLMSVLLVCLFATTLVASVAGFLLVIIAFVFTIYVGSFVLPERLYSWLPIFSYNSLVGVLEQRVSDRTRALAASAEVSRRLSTILETNQLVREVVERLQEAFNFYHVHIYLFDEKRNNLIMAGGTGTIGQALLAKGHRIPRGKGLVGRAAETGELVLEPDVTQAAGWLPNPQLPETKSELSVPIRIGDNVLGVLDVQQNKLDGFSSENVELVQSIANQVAIALRNARTYAEMQREASREALITAIGQRIQKTTSAEDALRVAVREVGRALNTEVVIRLKLDQPEDEALSSDDLPADFDEVRGAAAPQTTRQKWEGFFKSVCSDELCFYYSGEDVQPLNPGQRLRDNQAVVNIEINHQTIGEFGIAQTDDISSEDSELAAAVSEQLGAHLENMRLYMAAQQELEERRRTEQILETQRRTLQAVLDNMPAGVFMVEAPSGRPVLSNKKAQEFLGRGISGDAVGDDLNQVYQSYKFGTDELYPTEQMPVIAGLAGKTLNVNDMEVRRPDGSRVLLEVTGTPVYDQSGAITASLVMFQDITERYRAQETITKRASELATVSEVATTIATIQDPDEMLQMVVDLTKQSFGMYHAHIYLLNETGDSLVLARGAGAVGRQMVTEGRRIALDSENSLVARAARTQQGVIVNDVRQDPDFLPNRLLPETRSEMAVPMLVGDQVMGVLDIQSAAAGRFNVEDVNIMTTLAAQVAVALQNARQYAQTQALYEITSQMARSHNFQEVLHTLVKSTALKDFDNVALYFFDRAWKNAAPDTAMIAATWERSGMSSPMPVGQPIPLQTFAGIEKLIQVPYLLANDLRSYNDVPEGARAFLLQSGFLSALNMRLTVGDEWVGCISALSSKPKSITDEDLRRLMSLTEQSGTVIQSLKLLDQIQDALNETANLYLASRHLNEARTPQEMVKAVMSGLKVKDINRSLLMLFDQNDAGEIESVTVTANWHSGHGVLPVPAGSRYSAQVLESIPMNTSSSDPLFFDDVATDSRIDVVSQQLLAKQKIASMASLPLFLGGRPVGALILEAEVPHHFKDEEIRTFRALSSQLATAVESRRLFHAVQTRARHEQILREITARVRGSMDPDSILRIAVRELGLSLGRPAFVRLGDAQKLLEKPGSPESTSKDGGASASGAPASVNDEGGI